jgi:hypothetical protein
VKGRIDFQHLQADDVILAEPHWNIETDDGVHANNRVKLYTTTSSIRYDISREDAATVEDALEGIRASRRAAAAATGRAR